MSVEKICAHCDQAFSKTLETNAFNWGHQLYCSNRCKLGHRYARREQTKRVAKDPAFLARKRQAYHRYRAKPGAVEKIAARGKIKHLCRVGKITRGDCEQCGKPNAEAHHEDYSWPLDVRWLCHRCHIRMHHSSAA